MSSHRLLSSSVERRALVLTALLLGATGFLPQFGGPGYESALAGGLVLPSVAAVAAALLVSSCQLPTANCQLAPFDALGRGAALGGVLALGFAAGRRRRRA